MKKSCQRFSIAAVVSALSGFAVSIAILSLQVSCSVGDRYTTITGYAQGGTYMVKLKLPGQHSPSPDKIKEGIDSVLLCIDNSISGYNRGSILSRFNAGGTVEPDSIFLDIYRKSYSYYLETDGAVDVAAAPIFDIWGFGFTSDSLPSDETVRETLASCGMHRLRNEMVPDMSGSVSGKDLLADGVNGALPELNYNAVAQGYSCDLVARYLDSIGVEDMLVDVGGEIYCRGSNPSGGAWSVGVDRPVDGNNTPGADLQGVLLAGPEPCGIVTSGNYRKFYVKDGRKYAHTIDPRSGYPVSHSLLSATVIASDATVADALATYCMVLGLDGARAFIMETSGIEGYLIYDDNGVMKTWKSDGFRLAE